MASSFYPNPNANGLRLWLISTSSGQPSTAFNPRLYDSTNEASVLSYINGLRNCNPNGRSSLSNAMAFTSNLISESGRAYLVGIFTDRTNEEFNSDVDLQSSIQPFSARGIYPFVYYTGTRVPEYLSRVLQQTTIYRQANPVEAYREGITSEICTVLSSVATNVPSPTAPPPTPEPSVPVAPSGWRCVSRVSCGSTVTVRRVTMFENDCIVWRECVHGAWLVSVPDLSVASVSTHSFSVSA